MEEEVLHIYDHECGAGWFDYGVLPAADHGEVFWGCYGHAVRASEVVGAAVVEDGPVVVVVA